MDGIKKIIADKCTSLEAYVLTNWKTKRRKYKVGKSIKINERRHLSGYSAMAMRADVGIRSNTLRFDTDSAKVGIDNRCSACISHVPQDFIGALTDSNRTIKGFGGLRTTGVKVGTLL